MQELLHRSLRCDVRSVGLCHQDETDIAVEIVDRDHVNGGAERIALAEFSDCRRCLDGLDVRSHHFLDREVAHPADIRGAADGLAA